MTGWEEQLNVFIDSLKETECYRQYKENIEKIKENPALYQRISDYKKAQGQMNIEALQENFQDIFQNLDAVQFLANENQFLKILNVVFERLSEEAGIEFV